MPDILEKFAADALRPAVPADDGTAEAAVPFARTQIAQGDIVLELAERLPDGLAPVPPAAAGCWWLMPASEGRPEGSHSIEATRAVAVFAPAGQDLPAYVVVSTAARVEHAPKSGETGHHAAVSLPAGVWRIRRQREHVPSAGGMPAVDIRAALD